VHDHRDKITGEMRFCLIGPRPVYSRVIFTIEVAMAAAE
jgi:hypothetical protein